MHAEKLNDARYLAGIREVAAPVCAAHRVALVDARWGSDHGLVLKVLIERPGADPKRGAGVSLDDCQAVSRDLSTALDVSDGLTPDAGFRLEVGSPGLDRPLFSLDDFARFAGESARIATREPIDGRRRFSGKLLGVRDAAVRLEQDGREVSIPHAEIAKANLVYRFG